MITAIIFDCFGVLAQDGWGPFKERYFSDKPEALRQVQAIGHLVDAGKTTPHALTQSIARVLNMTEEQVHKEVNCRVPNEQLFTYIRDELKPLYKIGLLSNASYDIRTELFTPAQNAVFDAGLLSYDIGLVKTDPAMYAAITEQLGVEATECVMIDDRERYCEAAEAAGMRTILYTNFADFQRSLENMVQ